MLNRRAFFRRAAATLGALAAGSVIAKQAEAAPKLIHGEAVSTSKSISTAGFVAVTPGGFSQMTSSYAQTGIIQDFGSQTLTVTDGLPGPMQQVVPAGKEWTEELVVWLTDEIEDDGAVIQPMQSAQRQG